MAPPLAWNAVERDQVAERLKAGISMGAIAKELGVTRNVVVGRVYRDGSLHAFAGNVQYRLPREKKMIPIIARVVKPPAPAIDGARPMLELGANQCKWPVVEAPVVGGFLFCCLAVVELDRPYCAYHTNIARTGV